MKKSSKILLIFTLGAVCILTTLVVTFLYGRQVMRMNRELLRHRSALGHLEEFISMLKDAETGQRGYIITGDEKYLAPYKSAMTHLQEELDTLRALNMGGNAPSHLDAVTSLTAQKTEELKQSILQRTSEGFEPVQKRIQLGRGLELMDEIRFHVIQMQDEQRQAMEAAVAASDQATQIRTTVFVVAGLANLLFLAWAFRRIQEEIDREAAASAETARQRDEMLRQKDLLNVTLSSIGDCVIVTDMDGRITFMNVVAAELTGWTIDEVLGRPVGEIFKIINEYTRETVESPVEKVLRLGQIVGLANHTLLIRKDGTEVPIDDSGSPIREKDGTLRGVVLVFRDFSEHKNAQRSLEAAKLAAENANHAKDQFLAMLSHELRTPLTPVLATFSIWEMNREVPEALKEDVKMMRHSIELEARLIDDLLDLTRIVKGILHLSPETSNIHELLESVVTMYTSEIQSKNLLLNVNLTAENHHARVDSARAQQVFWNLIKNATKFTERGGSIRVTTENDLHGNLKISFADTGIGISEETLERLFLPFEQGEHKLTHRYEGLGLGLAISKALVDAMGGTIVAESAGKGMGATFTVTFPVVEVSPTKPLPDKESGMLPSAGKSLKIMLLEDHAFTVHALTRLLVGRGHQIKAVNTVAAGKELLRSERFDLLLCDIGLPDGTGMDFLREVRKTDQTPAVALSGFGMEEDVARCEEAGFNAHLTKPIDLQRLEGIINRFTKS